MSTTKTYRVKAPYVTLRTGTADGPRVIGLYAGAPVPSDVSAESLKHHLDNDLIEQIKDPTDAMPGEGASTETAIGGESAVTDEGAGSQQEQQQPAVAPAPAKTASKQDWVAYAVSQGADQAEAEAATKDQLVTAYGS